MKLYVSFLQVLTVFGNQTVNAMSALNDIYSLMYALFAVTFVNFYITSWQVNSYDID